MLAGCLGWDTPDEETLPQVHRVTGHGGVSLAVCGTTSAFVDEAYLSPDATATQQVTASESGTYFVHVVTVESDTGPYELQAGSSADDAARATATTTDTTIATSTSTDADYGLMGYVEYGHGGIA